MQRVSTCGWNVTTIRAFSKALKRVKGSARGRSLLSRQNSIAPSSAVFGAWTTAPSASKAYHLPPCSAQAYSTSTASEIPSSLASTAAPTFAAISSGSAPCAAERASTAAPNAVTCADSCRTRASVFLSVRLRPIQAVAHRGIGGAVHDVAVCDAVSQIHVIFLFLFDSVPDAERAEDSAGHGVEVPVELLQVFPAAYEAALEQAVADAPRRRAVRVGEVGAPHDGAGAPGEEPGDEVGEGAVRIRPPNTCRLSRRGRPAPRPRRCPCAARPSAPPRAATASRCRCPRTSCARCRAPRRRRLRAPPCARRAPSRAPPPSTRGRTRRGLPRRGPL